jgi:hypothetical protein
MAHLIGHPFYSIAFDWIVEFALPSSPRRGRILTIYFRTPSTAWDWRSIGIDRFPYGGRGNRG